MSGLLDIAFAATPMRRHWRGQSVVRLYSD
jgi:hypothetical protein